MNIRSASFAAALTLLSSPAWAGDDPIVGMNPVVSTGRISVDQLAREAGVAPSDVRMVLGAHTPFGQYRVCYERTEARVKAATERILYAQRGDQPQQRVASLAKP